MLFAARAGTVQLVKNLLKQHPHFFKDYTYVWVCDDDIQMQAAQIDEAFAITDPSGFWVAQPAFLPKGRIRIRSQCMRILAMTTELSISLRRGFPFFVGTN